VFFPDHKQVQLDLAYSYMELKNYEQALNETKELLKRWPDDLNAHYLAAEIFIVQDDFESVKIVLDEISLLKPKESGELIELGDMAFKKNAFDTAEMIYEAALASGDDPDGARRRLGDLFNALGDSDKAARYWQGQTPEAAPEPGKNSRKPQ